MARARRDSSKPLKQTLNSMSSIGTRNSNPAIDISSIMHNIPHLSKLSAPS
jgi:hypothetical protein